jgi:hypothetical protein
MGERIAERGLTVEEVQAMVIRAAKDYRAYEDHLEEIRTQEERRSQEWEALVAAKLAEGKPLIQNRNLIALLDLETEEESVYYFICGEVYYRNDQPIFEDYDPIPALPEGVTLLRTSSPVGSALIGHFVGDEITVDRKDGGTTAFRIADMPSLLQAPCKQLKQQHIQKNDDKSRIYSGRGPKRG